MISKRALFLICVLTACTRAEPPPAPLPFKLEDLKNSHVSVLVKTFDEIDEETAKSMIRQKLFLIRNLFRDEKSPYPGMTSNIVKCPEKFHPVIAQTDTAEQSVLRVQIYANSRRVFGVCSETDAKFKSVYLLVYCKRSRKAAQVEGFSENKDLNWGQWLVPGSCL